MGQLLVALKRCESGTSSIEYALLSGSIALAVITALGVMGTELTANFDRVADIVLTPPAP